MKNREKFKYEIIDFACTRDNIAVNIKGEVVGCCSMQCKDCMFYEKGEDCEVAIREWLEKEYIEPLKISKKDKTFLEYIGNDYKYIARDSTGDISLYTNKPERNKEVWLLNPGFVNLKRFNVDFPMVKWEDEKPWLVEDLKQLEVVDNY